MTSRAFHTLVVILAGVVTVSATDIFLPSLPTMATYFGASEHAVQLAIPIYLLGSFVAALALGVLSDHFGRKRIMLLGLVLFLGGTALCIFSPSLPLFLSARFIQGVGATVSPVVGWAVIQDLYSGNESAKIMSWMGSIVALAPLIAPGLGGYVHMAYGWQGNFFLIFGAGSLILTLMSFSKVTMKSLSKTEKLSFQKTFKTYGRIITDKPFLFYVFLFGILNCGAWSYLTVIPFYFENLLDVSPDILGLYLSGGSAFFILGMFATPAILKRIAIHKTLVLGISLTLGGSSLLLCISYLAPHAPFLIVMAFGFYFFGSAVVWGPSTSRALQRFDDIRGAASGVRSLILMGSFALGGFMGSLLDDSSLLPLSLFLLSMSLLCGFMFQRLNKLESLKISPI